MISHSFKEASNLKFKCDECEFWGPNAHSMKMHFKRLHCESISCGMCGFEASDLKTLDTHTFTCEMFKCTDCGCGEIFHSISDIKEHVYKKHKGYSNIKHYYRWKSNEEFFTDNFHRSIDLFRNEKN